MTLAEQLAEYRAEFTRTAPEGRAALYESKVEELRRYFPIEQAVQSGAAAPGFSLPDARGQLIALDEALEQGPVVLTFYRGGWCPYCNFQLRAYQQILPQINARGASLIAVSPQSPDASLSTAEKNALAFSVLSDAGNEVARRYGLVYSLAEELRDALRSNGKPLPGFNGDESWELPLTATYIIAPSGRVELAFLDMDYRVRLEPAAILEALDKIGG